MAHAPIVENARRFPKAIAEGLRAYPHRLRDEPTDTVGDVCEVLVAAGHRAELMAICEGPGLDEARCAIIRSACGTHVH
jgi:hypothetical protein